MDMMGDLIRQARRRRGLTQGALAKQLNTSRTTIQYLEGNRRNCSVEMLSTIHRELEAETPLSVWVLASLARTVAGREGLDSEIRAALHDDVMTALDAILPNTSITDQAPASLAEFPRGFEPLTVVVGDRREDPPITRGDLLAGSASTEDVRHILSLALQDRRSVIRTDKVIMNAAGDDDIKHALGGSNLLVVGSPFVNYAARVANRYSAFKFGSMKVLRGWRDNLEIIRRIDGAELNAFAAICQGRRPQDRSSSERQIPSDRLDRLADLAERLRGSDSRQSLREAYRPSAIIDPIQLVTHPATSGSNISYGLISLTRNPFSESRDHVAVMVGGAHLPGTVQALRALSERDLDGRPFGGVIEVVHPGNPDEAWWTWKTPRYEAGELINNLKMAQETSQSKRTRPFKMWTDDEILDCLQTYEGWLGD